ncbi:MAG: GTP-binding protein, partial [Lachnospiraceae bacterium]|nr:GTP-binding protein [Lachnospiraceae bacterium]
MTKIDIVSGFLGAGKTTLIKKLVSEAIKNEKVVLIENEFGEVGIDGGFLKDAGIEITEMNSGCICCTLVGDFAKNMKDVLDRFSPDRIIIEPSGVGKLSDVMASVIEMEEKEDVKLNALVTVVNAKKAKKQMKGFGEFFNNQIEFATTVILSRADEADAATIEEVVNVIREKNEKALIVTTSLNELSGEKILNAIEGKDTLQVSMEAMKAHQEEEHEHH